MRYASISSPKRAEEGKEEASLAEYMAGMLDPSDVVFFKAFGTLEGEDLP